MNIANFNNRPTLRSIVITIAFLFKHILGIINDLYNQRTTRTPCNTLPIHHLLHRQHKPIPTRARVRPPPPLRLPLHVLNLHLLVAAGQRVVAELEPLVVVGVAAVVGAFDGEGLAGWGAEGVGEEGGGGREGGGGWGDV